MRLLLETQSENTAHVLEICLYFKCQDLLTSTGRCHHSGKRIKKVTEQQQMNVLS